MLDPFAVSKLGEWLASGQTGLSSLTMAAIAMGAERGDFHVPCDQADFGRCLALLKKVPEIKYQFPQIAWYCPDFGPILKQWKELSDLYESGEHIEVYRLLRELREVKS